MCGAFERELIRHCAATLAGHKCGSLFSWRACPGATIADCLREANRALAPRGVRLYLLRRDGDGGLVYVYRPSMLKRRLQDAQVRRFLAECGYGGGGCGECLRALARRASAQDGFPHEIGVFLDYPLEDVLGFIRHGGGGYRCVGCWKVYGDEQAARRRFELYRKCQRIYLECYRRGFGVARLTVAA